MKCVMNHCLAARASSCSECLQAGVNCAYCADEDFTFPRCDIQENLKSNGCKVKVTMSSKMTIEKSDTISTSLNVAQVYPKLMSMSLLPGEEREVAMEIFEPEKGPLDLYILMDFSNSMEDDLDNLKRMGAELADLVGTLSNDYTIGFGKFVDKVTEPQTDMRPSKLKQPWPNSDPPFSFQNTIPLTSNISLFRVKLEKERISGNLDAPEGGFDAILQAAVCQRQIGWRKDATHLLVFSTESAFHYEADGTNVLAGILPRNDEQCHLTEDGSYTHDTLQDYPSVPTLVRLLGKHNIIPIFAVTNHSYSYYEKLHSYFPIADIGELQEDSSNILSIMKSAFTNIRSKISMRAEDKPRAVETMFLQSIGEQQVCSLSEAERKGMMRVKPTTFSAYLGVETEVLCATCECEKVRLEKRSSSNNGDLICGMCKCYAGWLGPFCNCSAALSNSDYQGCKTPDSQAVCSNHGDCLCGTCICHNPQQYEGPYCQYDKTQCARFSGFLCNDRGRCYMGSCACEAGWEGSACECPKSNQTCLDSKGGICNGRGTCQCGRCVCDNSNIYVHKAQLGMCEDRRTCVQCQAWKTGELKGEKCKDCPFKITMVDELKDSNRVIEKCSFRDEEDDCTYHYSVEYPSDPTDTTDEVQASIVMTFSDWCFVKKATFLLPARVNLACLSNHALSAGRMVGFKEDQYMLRHSTLTSDYLDTPLVRTGPPKSTDVVRWKITDNVHRSASQQLAQVVPNPKENSKCQLHLSLREVFGLCFFFFSCFRTQPNAGKRQNHTVVDTVLSAPRAAYPDIVNLTEKSVQSGNFGNLKVVPGYYTVATDRDATGAVEMQEGVESVDVRVPLFVKDEDDDKKQLRVEATDVPLGIAEIGRRFVNITIIKDHAKSVLTFLQPSYVYSRQDKVAKIPVSREIIEDGHTQVSYRTRDLTAKDQKDYISVDGDLSYQPGETQKVVPVKLLELGEADSLLSDKQVKQFVMDLSNPRQGAKLGRYPRTTVTIADQLVDKVQMEFTQSSQSPGGRLFSPSNIKPTATGPKSIHLNWDAPHGNPQGYKVKYWIQGDPETDAQVVDCKTTHTELTNLYPYCDYEMRVCGYNTLGDGVSSDVVHCQTLEDVPSEPGRLAFNVISPTVTQLSWAEPAETNGIITAYEVIYTPIDEDNQPTGPSKKVKIDNPKKRMLLIENLQPSQTYRYNVRACNSVGWGPYRDATINLASQPSRPMSIPIIPDIPIVDAEAGEGYDSFLMYSSDVLRSPGGRPSVSDEGLRWKHVQLVGEDLDLRKVSWRLPAEIIPQRLSSDTEASDEPPRPGRAQTPLQGEDRTDRRMTALPATTPTAKAKALQKPLLSNILDTQITTAMILTLPVLWYLDPRFTPGVPDTPSRLVFSALGPTALKVSWQEPHCEREVLGYCVLYQLLNGGEMKRIDVPGNAENSVVVQDLLPNHSYIFKVKAQSQEGWGPEREGVITIESAVDPRSPLSPMPGSPFTLSTPSAPGPLVFTALSPDALQLSWDKPRKPNGDIVGYMVTCEQLHGGGDVRSFQVSGDGAETSLTVSDLAENVPYKFKVQARTTQGFGPEREGIITIESQDGGTGYKFTPNARAKCGMFVCRFTDGMMVTTQHMETGGSITRHVTKEVVTRSVMSGTSGVTKKVEKFFEA
uniref:Integrin beta n=1 Tax=Scleropages formosus TaxID=113540 RepID=A0A8C9TJC1_SCLFO